MSAPQAIASGGSCAPTDSRVDVRVDPGLGGADGPPALPVSLVVCTRDRADRLERLLVSVGGQEGAPSFELVVVDNGSRDRTPSLLADFAEAAPFPVVVVREPVPGLGRARNRGVAAARGRLVAFTDDDCRLPPRHLAAVAEAFDDLAVAWLGGRILADDGPQARVALLEDTTFRYFPRGGIVWVGAVQGANLAVERAALLSVGGFDPRLGAGTEFRCEDVDLCARLVAAGYLGARCPDLVVFHAHGRDEAAAGTLDAANDVARGAFVAERLSTGGPDARAYLAAWAAHAARRWGWRPRNAARASAATARELRGALRWWSAGARAAGPAPERRPAGAPRSVGNRP